MNSNETAEVERQARRAWSARLAEEHSRIRGRYQVRLPPVVVEIDDAQTFWGRWRPDRRVISISRRLIRERPWAIVVEVLKHEMAHQYVTDLLKSAEQHGPGFRAACELLRVAQWARTASGELPHELPDGHAAQSGADTEENRLLRRAEKLLALAESANEHEAALAMQRVRELYARHNLEHLQRRSQRQWVSVVIPVGRSRIEAQESLIAVVLSEHFFVQTLIVDTYDPVTFREMRAIDVLGTRENVELAEYVFHFLRKKLEALWVAHRAATGAPGRSRRDFQLGVLAGFREKLKRPFLTTDETSLIRAGEAALHTWLRTMYPNIRTTHVGGGGRDAEAYAAGQAQGRELNIHKGVTVDSGSRGRLLGRDD